MIAEKIKSLKNSFDPIEIEVINVDTNNEYTFYLHTGYHKPSLEVALNRLLPSSEFYYTLSQIATTQKSNKTYVLKVWYAKEILD